MSRAGVARGGKAVYGAAVGILMLEARFPRIPGDVGNASTWPFPVLYKVVPGARPERVVRHRAKGLLEAFVAGGRELVAQGADGIVTNCGFLSLFQEALAAACGVPVASSALMQAALVERLLPPGKRVGILTVSAASLSAEHLQAAGVALDTPVVGADGRGEFSRALLGNELELDVAQAEADILAAGDELIARHPNVGAVLLECTNMCPYAAALRERLGLPVFDMVSFITWFHGGLVPRRWPT